MVYNGPGEDICDIRRIGSISGLVINKAKTNLMISGKEWEGGESVLGIKIVPVPRVQVKRRPSATGLLLAPTQMALCLRLAYIDF